MHLNKLGSTGLFVSELCLGTMTFGGGSEFWDKIGALRQEDADRLVGTAIDAGINFLDTADMYSAGESETIVGKALRGRRDDVVLASKFHFPMSAGSQIGDRNRGGNSRRWIRTAVHESLRRLGTDHLDLYQVHRPDGTTDIDETLGALSDLVRDGTIVAYGLSTFSPDLIVEAQQTALTRGHVRPWTEQPPYSLLARGVEESVLPTCERYGMGVLTWSPLAFGFLTGRYRRGQSVDLSTGRAALAPDRFDPADPRNAAKYDAIEALASLADDCGLSLPHLALAFPVTHPAVTSVIVGPRTMEQLQSQLAAAPVRLDDDVLDRIDAIVPPGTQVYDPNANFLPSSLTDPARRRRPADQRAAA